MDKAVVVPVEFAEQIAAQLDAIGLRKWAERLDALIAAAPAPAAQESELKQALRYALEWIDAVPDDVQLPTMPGFDRDWADSLLEAPAADANLRLVQDAQEGIPDELRCRVLEDLRQRLSYGPNDEAAIGAYETLYELNRVAGAADKPEGKAEQQAEPVSGDAEYAVVVDRRDLFDYLRAAWRDGQSYGASPEAESWREASIHAANRINEWSTMQPAHPPAQPRQLTDEAVTPERLADCIPQTATFSAVDNYVRMTYQELQQFARALLAAGKERT